MKRVVSMGSALVALAALSIVAQPSSGQDAALVEDVVEIAHESERQHVYRTEPGGPELSIVHRVQTGIQPKSVIVSPDGRRVVVCNFGRTFREDVSVFDADTLEQVGAIEFEGNAVEAAFTPDGSTLFVSNFFEHKIEVIDFTTLRVRTEIGAGVHPKYMVVSPDGSTLYIANWGERTVSVIDVATLTQVRRLHTERHPRGMVVRPDGTLLAAAFHGDVLHVFPRDAARELERWEMCTLPRHLALSPDGATLYVTCSMGVIGFYDAATGRRTRIAPTGRNPRSIAINGDGRWIGVANFSSSDVTLIDTAQRRHRTYEVPGAHGIVGLAMHPGPRARIYATSWDTHELIVLEEQTETAPSQETGRATAITPD